MSKELTRDEYALLSKGIISIRGEIKRDTLDYIENCMLQLAIADNPDIEIWFASHGGDIEVGTCIFDMLRLYPGVITGYVVSYAYSSAAIILQACDYRVGHPSSRLMVHNCSLTRTYSYDEIKKGVIPTKSMSAIAAPQKRIVSILKDVTGLTTQELRKILKQGEIVSAKEAKQMRLLDEIQ